MNLRTALTLCAWLLLSGCQSPGAARREYAQTLDTGTNACRHNPAYCAPPPGEEAVIPLGLRPATLAAVTAMGTLRRLTPTSMERIKEIVETCANQANQDVNLRLLEGKTPTKAQCDEQVGIDAEGKPVTRAQYLGREKHRAARSCVEKLLSIERPGGFSLDQRYRYDLPTRVLELVTPAEEQAILRANALWKFLGTLIPDVVIHLGDPLKAEAVFDFKFPCPISNPAGWRPYPRNHPYAGRNQGQLYEQAFGVEPWLVVPQMGAFQ